MRLFSAIVFLMLFAVALAADAAPLPAPRQVDISSRSGTLHAQLYRPDGDGPFPAVIALHGCGGLAGHAEPIQQRYRELSADPATVAKILERGAEKAQTVAGATLARARTNIGLLDA